MRKRKSDMTDEKQEKFDIKAALSSDKLEERLKVLDAFQEVDAQLKDARQKMEEFNKSKKEWEAERASLQNTNQQLFLRVGGKQQSEQAITKSSSLSDWIKEAS